MLLRLVSMKRTKVRPGHRQVADRAARTIAASPSSTLLRTSRLVARLLLMGLPMGPLRILETTGHKSGLPRTTPVALTTHEGNVWLVSPFGVTDWVRNVRVLPQAHLIQRRTRQPVQLSEVDDRTAAPVLRAFLRSYRRVPFVPPAFAANPDSDVALFLAEASRHPVFRISTEGVGPDKHR